MAQNTKTKSLEETNSEELSTSDKEVAVLEKQAEYKKIDEDNFAELEEESFNQVTKDEEPIASNFIEQPNKKNRRTPVSPSPETAKNNDAKGRTNNRVDMVQVDTKPPLKKIETPSSDWTFPVEEEMEEEVSEEAISDHALNAEDDAYVYSPSKRVEPTLNSQGNPVSAKDKQELATMKNKSAKSSTPSYTEKEKHDTPQKIYSVSQFNWMTGDWRDISIGGSYESWEVSKNGLNGSGYVVISNDTSFVEEMRIYQRGKDIFFEGPVDASQKIRKFKLESYEGNEATFNRKGKNFPNQVVITRHTNNSYSIVYQNKDAITIDTTEQLYFKYRNRLNNQRAARNMTRY